MIPVYDKVQGAVPPAETHYIRAQNGVFMRKVHWWVDATVKLAPERAAKIAASEATAELLPETTSATLLLPPLPSIIMRQSLELAREINDMFESEVCLLLFWSKEKGYELFVPTQGVSRGGVEYHPHATLGDAQYVGTIHSHGDIPAFPSATDEEDEKGVDGVHIIVGSLDWYPEFTFSADIVVNGNRFPVERSWFGGLKPSLYKLADEPGVDANWQVPQDWLDRVTKDDRVSFLEE